MSDDDRRQDFERFVGQRLLRTEATQSTRARLGHLLDLATDELQRLVLREDLEPVRFLDVDAEALAVGRIVSADELHDLVVVVDAHPACVRRRARLLTHALRTIATGMSSWIELCLR